MISQSYFFRLSQVRVVVNRWVQVEKNRQVDRLIWVQELVLEAKALYFVEIEGALFWEDLVDGNTCDWLVRSVENFIEREGSLACID